MKKVLFFIFSLLTIQVYFSQSANAQVTNWLIDKTHSSIIFNVSHMVISEVSGYFREFDGKIVSKNDNFEDSYVEISIKASSINTDNEKRDTHLKSPDFFDTEKFPMAFFKSKSFKKTDDNSFDIVGDLTIKGVTKEVVLKAKLNGTMKDPYGNLRSGWKATVTINRFDYGVSWSSVLETGGLMVGKEVTISINAEFIQEKK